MNTISLFRDVADVQKCLETYRILDYDANRIFELLEAHVDHPSRVIFVAESIRDRIASDSPAGDYNVLSPDVVEVPINDDDDTLMPIPLAIPLVLPPENPFMEPDLDPDAVDYEDPDEIWLPPHLPTFKRRLPEQEPGWGEIMEMIHNDCNNNDEDPNNNATPDLEIVAEKRTGPPVDIAIWSEALMIQNILPDYSLEVIKEHLTKHIMAINRVQIVTHQLLEKLTEDLPHGEGAALCPVPAKKAKPATQPESDEPIMFFSPAANKGPLSNIFGYLPFGRKTTKTGPPNCTIVRPEQEKSPYETSLEAPSTSALQPHEQLALATDTEPDTDIITEPAEADQFLEQDPAPATSTSRAAEPVASTSRAAEPVASTSRAAEPVASTSHAAEPVASTSHAAEPVASTSRTAEPVASTSHAAEPVASTSHAAEPVASTSRTAEPVASTSLAAEPVASTSHAAEPVASTSWRVERTITETITFEPRASPVATTSLVTEPFPGASDGTHDQPVDLSIAEKEPAADALQAAEMGDVAGPSTAPGRETQAPVEMPAPSASADTQRRLLGQLRELFPHVKVSYLERLCAERADDYPVEFLIDEVLNEPNLPVRLKVKAQPKKKTIDPNFKLENEEAVYQAFMEIFPDADPEYLESKYKSVSKDPDELKLFIANALEKKDYPKLEAYQKRQAQFALEKQFKDNFNMLKFLELFPDPFTHFRDPLLSSPKGPLPAGRAFLMARYRQLRCVTIDKAYKNNQFMLYPTCKELDVMGSEMRPRQNHEIISVYKSETSLGFLQEIGFIENEAKILDHFKEIADAEKKALADREEAFANAKKLGELLTCGCCYDEEVLDIDMVTCEEGHLFCKECVKKGAEVQIGQGKTDFPCLEDCGANIRLETLQSVLLPAVFSRLVQRKQMEEVKAAGIESFETCPFCDFGMVPHPDDRVFACQNPECLKHSCRLCKEPSHIPLRCDEVEKSEEVKARTYIEDKMTEALIRTCWKCQKKFVKSDGCNKMTCSCGALMCYVCRQPVKDYSHFNGQGGDAFEKCPLYSNNNQLHVDAVEKEGRKAKEELELKNPALALKHDPTMILPEKAPVGNNARIRPVDLARQNHENFLAVYDQVAGVMQFALDGPLRGNLREQRGAADMAHHLYGNYLPHVNLPDHRMPIVVGPGGEAVGPMPGPVPAAARPVAAAGAARPVPEAGVAQLVAAARVARPIAAARVARPIAAARVARPIAAAGAARPVAAAGAARPVAAAGAARPVAAAGAARPVAAAGAARPVAAAGAARPRPGVSIELAEARAARAATTARLAGARAARLAADREAAAAAAARIIAAREATAARLAAARTAHLATAAGAARPVVWPAQFQPGAPAAELRPANPAQAFEDALDALRLEFDRRNGPPLLQLLDLSKLSAAANLFLDHFRTFRILVANSLNISAATEQERNPKLAERKELAVAAVTVRNQTIHNQHMAKAKMLLESKDAI